MSEWERKLAETVTIGATELLDIRYRVGRLQWACFICPPPDESPEQDYATPGDAVTAALRHLQTEHGAR